MPCSFDENDATIEVSKTSLMRGEGLNMTTAEHPTPDQLQLLRELEQLHVSPAALTRDLHTLAESIHHLHSDFDEPLFHVHALPDNSPVDALFHSGVLNSLASTVLDSVNALGAAMSAIPSAVSPQKARSLQAAENIWRNIDREYGMLTSVEVAELLGSRKPNRSIASTLRNEGTIVGIMRGNSYRFPGFQFDADQGAVVPVMPKLIAVARENERSDEDLVFWMTSASSFFREQDRPVDHLREEDRVLAAAVDQFEGTW